jgi:hypothetical protein
MALTNIRGKILLLDHCEIKDLRGYGGLTEVGCRVSNGDLEVVGLRGGVDGGRCPLCAM